MKFDNSLSKTMKEINDDYILKGPDGAFYYWFYGDHNTENHGPFDSAEDAEDAYWRALVASAERSAIELSRDGKRYFVLSGGGDERPPEVMSESEFDSCHPDADSIISHFRYGERE